MLRFNLEAVWEEKPTSSNRQFNGEWRNSRVFAGLNKRRNVKSVKNAGWLCGLHKSRYSVTFPGGAIYFSRFSRTNDRKFNSINNPTVVTTTAD